MSGSTGSKRVGNTKRPSAAKKWCFTWNNYGVDSRDLLEKTLAPMAPKFVFQTETSKPDPVTGAPGTKHLQGCVEFSEKCRPIECLGLDKSIHWESCRSWKHSAAYCSDPDKRDADGWVVVHGVPPPPPVWRVTLAQCAAYPWIAPLVPKYSVWPDVGSRLVDWYWSASANTGKSQLGRYLIDNHFAALMGGRKQDIAAALKSFHDSGEWPPILFFNLCRVDGNRVSYSGLEALKDGMLFAPKFDSTGLRFPSPHVVVVANEPPREELMGADVFRLNVVDVSF